MEYLIFYTLVVLQTSFEILADTKCDGKEGIICCFGFTWNEKYKKCIKCSPGYFGINCSKTCPYPNYGEKCKYVCSCRQETCDPSTGCVIKTTAATTSKGNYRLLSTELSTGSLNATTISERFVPTRKTKFTKKIYSSAKTGPEKFSSKYQGFEAFTPQSNQNTNNINRFKSMEEKIQLLLKIYDKDRQSHSLLQKRVCRNSAEECDHYHKMEDIAQLTQFFGGEGLSFDGMAKVKFKYDSEKNICALRFQQQPLEEEHENKRQLKARYEKSQEISTNETDEVTNNRHRISSDSITDSDNLEAGSKHPDQCGYLESVTHHNEESIDPYLSVIT